MSSRQTTFLRLEPSFSRRRNARERRQLFRRVRKDTKRWRATKRAGSPWELEALGVRLTGTSQGSEVSGCGFTCRERRKAFGRRVCVIGHRRTGVARAWAVREVVSWL
jgi:hypothetical protein